MKRWGLLCGLILLSAAAASAQGVAKVEVFAGYSYLHSSVTGTSFSANLNGGSASVSVNPTSWLGLVGDFGGYHGGLNSDSSGINGELYTYMFGPKSAFRVGRFTPFVQSLFGGIHASSGSAFGSENAFAMATGGGLDVNAAQHLGIRLVQAEYVLTTLHDGVNNRQNSVRVSAGIVFRW
ncbi:MAG TPA: outer membrane beta-barrel protein [Candidatus Aquilonibacter sp.]|nr:outer membrane beta-barrel protein [Candidatus Aquilonibacter sp.]